MLRERRMWMYRQDAPPTGGQPPVTPPAPPAPPQTPPGQSPAAAPPAAPPVAPPTPSGWDTTFPGAKPEDVVLALRTLKGQVDTLRAQPPAGAPAAAVAPAEPDLKELILDDPEKALDHHLDKRVGPIVREFYDHAAGMTRMATFQQVNEQGKPRFPHAKRFAKEIDGFMQNVDPRLKSKPESWESAYNFVVGANYEKLVEEARAQGAPPVEGTGGAPGTPPAPKITLDEQESRVARGMGMTPEDYVAWRDGTHG